MCTMNYSFSNKKIMKNTLFSLLFLIPFVGFSQINTCTVVAEISGSTTICPNQTTELNISYSGGTEPYSIVYTNGVDNYELSNLIGDSTNISISPNCTQNYSIVSVNDSYCTGLASGSANVIVLTNNIDLNINDTTICYNNSISIVASGSDNYTWNPSLGLSGTEGACVVANPSETTTYTVTGSYGLACISQKEFTITVDKILAQLPESNIVCKGDTINLSASVTSGVAPYTYLWEGTANTSNHISEELNENKVYKCLVTDAIGCTALASSQIDVYKELKFNIFSNVNKLCPGDSALLTANIYEGSGSPYTLTMDGEFSPLVSKIKVNQDVKYVFKAEDACMSVIDTLSIGTYPIPNVDFTDDKLLICENEQINFEAIIDDPSLIRSYLWNFGTENSTNLSLAQNPTHQFDNYGKLDISLNIKTINDCQIEKVKEDLIWVKIRPYADFESEPANSILNPKIYFNNLSADATTYQWTFDNKEMSDKVNPEFLFNGVGEHSIRLIASTPFSCVDTCYGTITIINESKIWIADAFTPDNDGVNELFLPKGTGILEQDYQFIIYDRWGEFSFESNELCKGWSGKAKDGAFVRTGAYPYIINYYDVNNIYHQKKGTVNVIY